MCPENEKTTDGKPLGNAQFLNYLSAIILDFLNSQEHVAPADHQLAALRIAAKTIEEMLIIEESWADPE